MAAPINRAIIAPLDVDALRDAAFSNYSATDVMVVEYRDNSNNVIHIIYNISGSTIDPNAISTYDQAPTSSQFVDGPAGDIWGKEAATTWTSQTA